MPPVRPDDPTRFGAFAILRAVLGRRETLDSALHALPAMDARDRAAAHRLAASALRHAGTLDEVLAPHVRKAPPAGVKYILYIGAAGLLFLDTPAHAAVGTSVALARAAGFAPFAGMVNAVLRRVADGGVAVLGELDMPRLDTPAWAWASWGADARAIATAHAQEAPLDVSAKPGVVMAADLLATGSWRFPAGTPVTTLPGFDEGDIWVQDAAAALPARLLDVRPGERVLDLCAAPGGKTAQLAAAGAVVTAVERDPARMAVLRENLARCDVCRGRRADLAAGAAIRGHIAGRAMQRHRHDSQAPGPAAPAPPGGCGGADGSTGRAVGRGGADVGAGWATDLCGVFAAAGRGRRPRDSGDQAARCAPDTVEPAGASQRGDTGRRRDHPSGAGAGNGRVFHRPAGCRADAGSWVVFLIHA
jgi:transcription termination factor NusB